MYSGSIPKSPKLSYLRLFAESICPLQRQSHGDNFAPVSVDTARPFYKACWIKWKQFTTRLRGSDWTCSCRSRVYGALHCLCDHIAKPYLRYLHNCPYLVTYYHVVSRQVVCDRCNELTGSIIHESKTSVSSVFLLNSPIKLVPASRKITKM